MKYYDIQSKQTGQTLFEGTFQSLTACIEEAVRQEISLNHADLRNCNLSNANLDDGMFAFADFSHSNLSGTNLSESHLHGATFLNTALYNTCIAYSNLTACNFTGASFGATDLCGSILNHAEFSTLSCFSIDFTKPREMKHCIFKNKHGHISEMSRPPIVITGFSKQPIYILDHDILMGHNKLDPLKVMKITQKLANRTIHKRLKNHAA